MSITAKTQQIRSRIIDGLMRDDKGADAVPTDPDTIALLLETMRDADRTDIAILKISSDNKNSESDREIALAMASITRERRSNPFEASEGSILIEQDPRLNIREDLLPEIMLSPGVTDIGISEETYDDFNARMESKE